MEYLKSGMGNGLITFAETAKHHSFTSAAHALCLTTGAVSQQLLQLEKQLGFPLFHRHSRGIKLTLEGAQLQKVVELSLQDINTLIGQLRSPQPQSLEIRLKLTPSFAFKWLVPRLENFHKQYPEIQIHTFAEGALVASKIKDYDLAIDYGPLSSQQNGLDTPNLDTSNSGELNSNTLNSELLMEEYLLPVMSPTYLDANPSLKASCFTSVDFSSIVLLHDAMPWEQAERDLEWKLWAETFSAAMNTDQGHFFNRTDMAMSAAEAGVGMAMARTALIKDELITQRLVSPFKPIPAKAGYFLISNTSSLAAEKFTSWLKGQIKQS